MGLADFRGEPPFSFGDESYLPESFFAAATGPESPLGVWDFLGNCFAAGIAFGVVFGGSLALLERMFEKAIGSEALAGLGSSFIGSVV